MKPLSIHIGCHTFYVRVWSGPSPGEDTTGVAIISGVPAGEEEVFACFLQAVSAKRRLTWMERSSALILVKPVNR